MLKYSPTGILNGYKQYASEGNESVKELFCFNDNIYIGGTIEANTAVVEIGEKIFIKPKSVSSGYTSYLSKNDFNSIEAFVNESEDRMITSSGNTENGYGLISVMPNPFTSTFSIKISSSEESTVEIKIFDAVGTKVSASEFDLTKGVNLQQNDALLKHPSGIYMLII
ncbi:MAG: T9SS type A sorting domain-containing protein, partial [Saprospiraceae bacterium]